MASWPLILREMRELSRQGQLFWIRVTAGAFAFLTTAALLLNKTFAGREVGLYLFTLLNLLLFVTIITIGPLITADCIAREKREGTLGLLFLAPLSSRDIIFSKLVMNALRAFTLLLAILPLMALPVVFGGVPLSDIFLWAVRHLLALSIALSSGILASTLYREFIQCAVFAEIFCLSLLAMAGGFIGPMALAGPPIALAVTLGTLTYCSNNLKERWEQDSAGYKQPFWIRFFSESADWRYLFRWNTRKARSLHPIAWLQEYSWSARLAKWGWCFFVLVIQVAVSFSDSGKRFPTPQHILAIIVILGIALSAANSFRSERLTGAMELLLVTPLSPAKIVGGRLWGIYIHFFPAMAILFFLWIASAPLTRSNPSEAYLALSSYLFLPMLGLFFSMLPWHFLVAWIVIFLTGAVLPLYLAFLLGRLFLFPFGPIAIAIQATLGVSALLLLQHRLRTRSFILH